MITAMAIFCDQRHEIRLATAELRRRHQDQARQFAVTAKHLAEFLGAVEGQEGLLGQRLRDAEARAGAPGAPDDRPPPGASAEGPSTAGAAGGSAGDQEAALGDADDADYEE